MDVTRNGSNNYWQLIGCWYRTIITAIHTNHEQVQDEDIPQVHFVLVLPMRFIYMYSIYCAIRLILIVAYLCHFMSRY